MSLAKKTLNGLKWSYIFTVINVISQLGLTVVLARLLSPGDYGLIAMGNVVLRFGSYFAQMGIAQSLIQRNEIGRNNVFTAYALSFILSLLFYIIIFFLAPLSVSIFSNPEIVTIVRVLAINLVFSSIATVSISLLRIKYKYRLLGTIDFLAFVIGNGMVAVIMAVYGFGVWSLVSAVLVQGFIQFILAFYFTREFYSFGKIDIGFSKKLLSYGSRFTTSTFLEVITYSADAVIVGHFFKEKVLGIYNRASLLVQLPSQYISANLIKVLFPTLNEVKNDRSRFSKYYQSVNFLLGFILFGVCVFISFNATEIVSVLLGKQWQEAIPILSIISLAVPFNLLINYNGLIYDVYGHLNQKILIKLLHMIAMLSLFFLMSSKGLEGIAYAYLITEVSFYFLYVFISAKLLKIQLRSVVRSHIPFVYISASVFIISFLIREGCHYLNSSNSLTLVSEMTICPLLCLVIFFVYAPGSVKDQIREMLPAALLDQNKYFNYLMKIKLFKKYWVMNWGASRAR